MTFDIDPCLDSLAVPYLTLPSASAWETLQSIADFALCRFYAARDGRIRAEYDMCTCPKTPLPNVAITPDNTFSHRLPLQPKLIVNRVVVPYTELVEKIDNPDEFRIPLKESDMWIENDHYVFKIIFKNLYEKVSQLIVQKDFETLEVGIKIRKIYSTGCIFETIPVSFDKLYLKVIANKVYSYKQSEIVTQENEPNLKANGINEYVHPLSNLMIGRETAEMRANAIQNKYGEGLEYAELEWKGTPELKVGDKVLYNAPGETQAIYTCLSNEMTFTGGLRCKTILRKE